MKKQKEYKLEEVIKNFYITEPLESDLATTVADKIFAKRNKAFPALDNWLYIFIGVLFAAGIIYGFGFLKQLSFFSGLIMLIPVAMYFGLSFKEYSLIHKRLLPD